MFSVTPIPAFQDNYIWMLEGEPAGQVAVVDPGDAQPVIEQLESAGLKLAAILITHHHNDHTGGVQALLEYADVPVYGPAESPFGGISAPLRDGSEIRLLGHRLQVREVPAHTLDHISYFQPDEQPQLFCGDTLFLAGCGRFFEGTAEQMLDAMQYFSGLPDATEVYCTHEYSLANLAFAHAVEPDNADIAASIALCQDRRKQHLPTLPSQIATERKINPFMRTSEPVVIAAAQQHEGHILKSETEVMAALREWKNQF